MVLIAAHTADVLLVRSGALLRIRVTTLAARAPLPGGTTVGEITGVLDAKTSITWNVVSASDIAGPSPWWKLFSS